MTTKPTRPGLLIAAAAGLALALAACGSSATTSPATTPAPATTAAPTTAAPTPAATAASPGTAASPTKVTPSPAKATPVTISIKGFMYKVSGPVSPGGKVMVTNADPESHTVTSEKKGAFDVTATGGGGTATLTAPTTPGSYMFVCTFHSNMMGTLVVK